MSLINLSKCRHLTKSPDVRQCPNLHTLDLSHTQITNTPNTQGLNYLTKVDLRGCHSLDPAEVVQY